MLPGIVSGMTGRQRAKCSTLGVLVPERPQRITRPRLLPLSLALCTQGTGSGALAQLGSSVYQSSYAQRVAQANGVPMLMAAGLVVIWLLWR